MTEEHIFALIPNHVYRELKELDEELSRVPPPELFSDHVLDNPEEFVRRVVNTSDDPAFYHSYYTERPGQLRVADVVVDMRQAVTAAENMAFEATMDMSAVPPVLEVPTVAVMPHGERRRIVPYRPW